MPVKVAITDDHPLIINGLRSMLTGIQDTEILFDCINGKALLEQLKQQQPDILLLDIQLPDIYGTALCRQVVKF